MMLLLDVSATLGAAAPHAGMVLSVIAGLVLGCAFMKLYYSP